MNRLWALLRDERGATATEYVLIIGVIVAAIIAAAMAFVPLFQEGVTEMGENIKDGLGKGHKY